MGKFFLVLYLFVFLPSFFVGTVLKDLWAFLVGTLAAIGFLVSLFIVVTMWSGAGGYAAVGAGLLVLYTIPVFTLCGGILAGIFARSAGDYFAHDSNNFKKHIAAVVSLVLPLIFALTFTAKDHMRVSSIQKANQKELHGYWVRDIEIAFGERVLTLPISPRLSISVSSKPKSGEGSGAGTHSFGRISDTRSFFSKNEDTERAVSFYALEIKGLSEHCEGETNFKCSGASVSMTKEWCAHQSNMTTTFWCEDFLDGQNIKFYPDEFIKFDQRRKWFEDPDTDYSRKIHYTSGNAFITVHKSLGVDMRGENIISVCKQNSASKKKLYCTLEYAVDSDILGSSRYTITTNAPSDEIAQGLLRNIKKTWVYLTET